MQQLVQSAPSSLKAALPAPSSLPTPARTVPQIDSAGIDCVVKNRHDGMDASQIQFCIGINKGSCYLTPNIWDYIIYIQHVSPWHYSQDASFRFWADCTRSWVTFQKRCTLYLGFSTKMGAGSNMHNFGLFKLCLCYKLMYISHAWVCLYKTITP